MHQLPRKVYQAQQVRELDRIAIEDYGIKGIELMQRAAKAVLKCIQNHWQPSSHISIFCGHGNNAGDGYFVASFALQAGFKVSVYAIGSVNKLTDDALSAYQTYQQQGGVCQPLSESIQECDLIVDALLGTGLTRQISGDYAQAIQQINQSNIPVIAVDIPSGIHADTGCVLGHAIKAQITVCFIALKQGLLTGDALDYCGKLAFSDLNLEEEIFELVLDSGEILARPTLVPRLQNTHKGCFGHVLIIGGNIGFSGAVRLTAEAALYAGAGLVTIATHPQHAATLNQGRFELMCHGIEDIEQLQALVDNADVLVLGMGLGQDDWGRNLFNAVIHSPSPMIIDADGLNLLAQTPSCSHNRILTPHPKEAARLLNCSTADISKNRFSAIKTIQQKYGGVCVLKGAGTLISNGGELFINPTGNPGMATAGMGDVLAGLIASLLAQGLSFTKATTAAVYIHGAAADYARSQQGERGLLASDLMPHIRKLVN